MKRKELSFSGNEGLIYEASKPRRERIVYLHGAGEFGGGLKALFRHPGLPSLLEEGLELDFDVLIPCGPSSGHWEPLWIDQFLRESDKGLRSKANNFHFMAFSRGCSGAYSYAAQYPSKVASIIALAGKRAPEDLIPQIMAPLLLIHGKYDAQIPFSESMFMYEAFRALGKSVEFIQEDADHFIPGEVFSREQIYSWQKMVCREFEGHEC